VSTSTILPGTLWTISARRSVKRKAGGRYAADLVLQLPVRGPVPLHSAFNLIGNTWCRLTPLHAGMANPYQSGSGCGVGMDPTIPWFSHRYSPVTPRKFELIPHVSQRLGFMLRSEGGVDANNFNDCLETSKHRVRVQCGQRIRIGVSMLTLSVSEIEMPSPSIQRPGDRADILACHWSSSVRSACAT
jgi:hypothetical protein